MFTFSLASLGDKKLVTVADTGEGLRVGNQLKGALCFTADLYVQLDYFLYFYHEYRLFFQEK